MKEIDRLLKQWIPVNTIIREEIREAIVQMKMEAMDRAFQKGYEACLFKNAYEAEQKYKLNTNKDG
jgi:hypothetical protein